MNTLRKIIKESIQLAENINQADKLYFSTGKLSPRVREVIMHITGGDAWTKLLTDIYYAEMMQWKKTGHWALDSLMSLRKEIVFPKIEFVETAVQ